MSRIEQEQRMFDYKTHGIAPERADVLETYAGQIATLDHGKLMSLIDLGDILEAAAKEADEAALQVWAVQRCHLTVEQCDLARRACFQLKPHYQRLERMDASTETVVTLLEGFDEDVDHGVDTLETYGPIGIADLEILMGATEPPADTSACHPLLRLSRTAMEELIALKTKSGLTIFLETIAHLVDLVSRLEAVEFSGGDADHIRRSLTASAREAMALFESLALLPHRRIADPSVIHASWPPQASAWHPLWEALGTLEFADTLDEESAATARTVLERFLGRA
jgi:hypothetical protein